ncbi:hypothetical protein PCE1_004275 [Barthelona sp. PCE]
MSFQHIEAERRKFFTKRIEKIENGTIHIGSKCFFEVSRNGISTNAGDTYIRIFPFDEICKWGFSKNVFFFEYKSVNKEENDSIQCFTYHGSTISDILRCYVDEILKKKNSTKQSRIIQRKRRIKMDPSDPVFDEEHIIKMKEIQNIVSSIATISTVIQQRIQQSMPFSIYNSPICVQK